jgi:hypothetical protein
MSASMLRPDRSASLPATSNEGAGPAGTSTAGGAPDRTSLRGMNYADGAAALSPVQLKPGVGVGARSAGSSKAGSHDKPGGASSGGAKTKKSLGGGGSSYGEGAEIGGIEKIDDIEKPELTDVNKSDMEAMTGNLGEVADMSTAFGAIAGALTLCAPRPGTSAHADFAITIYASGFYCSLELKGDVKHTEHGFELGGAMGLGIGVGVAAAQVTAWAGLEGTIGFDAKGDSANECLDLVGLGIYNWLTMQEITVWDLIYNPVMTILQANGGNTWLADMIFGEGFDEEVMAKMDPKGAGDEADTLSYYAELGLDAGIAAELGAGNAKVGIGANLDVGYKSETTLSKGDDGKLDRETEAGCDGSVGLDATFLGFKVSGACNFWIPKGGVPEVELCVEIQTPGGPLAGMAIALWDVWGEIIKTSEKSIPYDEVCENLQNAAVTLPRAGVMGYLTAMGFAHPGIEFVYSMSGPECSIGLELVNHVGFDVRLGAGVGGGSLETDVATKTEIYHDDYSTAAPGKKGKRS